MAVMPTGIDETAVIATHRLPKEAVNSPHDPADNKGARHRKAVSYPSPKPFAARLEHDSVKIGVVSISLETGIAFYGHQITLSGQQILPWKIYHAACQLPIGTMGRHSSAAPRNPTGSVTTDQYRQMASDTVDYERNKRMEKRWIGLRKKYGMDLDKGAFLPSAENMEMDHIGWRYR